MLKKQMRRLISLAAALSLMLCGGEAALTASAATVSQGTVITRYDFDYAPSVMCGDGTQIKMWWGGGTGSGDGIYYSAVSSSGWSTPKLVMARSSSGWDSRHTCDPSVIKGSFNVGGASYAYAMYYTGTYDSIGYDSHIGVAFSNDGTTWTKYSGNPVVSPAGNAASQYGAGMQTVYRSSSGLITMMYFDSTLGKNCMVTSTDGVNFSGRTVLTEYVANEHSGDIAYSPTEGKWYVTTKSGTDSEIYIYETEGSALNGAWQQKGTISSVTTGKAKNHNPGWMRYTNGDIYIENGSGYKYIYYGSGSTSTATWDIACSVYTDGWEFASNGDRQGWAASNISNDTGPSGGYWIFVTSKSDPYLTSPAFEAPASAYSSVSVCIANQNSASDGRIYFKTAAENYYSEDKAVSFTCTSGGGWYTHTVDMTQNSKWTGTITGIRVDPVSSGSNAACGVDFIRLVK